MNKKYNISIFVAVFLLHYLAPLTTSCDSRWSILNAVALLKHGSFALNDYEDLLKQENNYYIVDVKGNKYDYFPKGTSLLIAPAVFVFLQIHGTKTTIKKRLEIEKFLAALLATLACCFFFRLSLLFLGYGDALLMTLVFSFATSVFTTASRGLWSHSAALTIISLCLYVWFRHKRDACLPKWFGFVLAFLFIVRPTTIFFILGLVTWAGIKNRKTFLRLLLSGGIVLALFVLYSWQVWGTVLPPYYFANRVWTNPHYGTALMANLFSPNRGLWVWSPVLLFAVPGLLRAFREKKDRTLYGILGLMLICHWLLFSSYEVWHLGSSIGPRGWTEYVPVWLVLVVLWFGLNAKHAGKIHSRHLSGRLLHKIVNVLFSLSALLSFAIHFYCATHPEIIAWNVQKQPPEMYIWDWNNVQFLWNNQLFRVF